MKKKKARRVKLDPAKSLTDRLARDYQKMHELYDGGNFEGLAKLLEEREAVLVTPDYRRIRGAESVALWKKAKAGKARLEIRTVNVFFGNALGKVRAGGRKFDSVAFVVHEVHCIEKTGPERRNATCYMETTYAHLDLCPWL